MPPQAMPYFQRIEFYRNRLFLIKSPTQLYLTE
jgi:hypothetical protein